MHFPEEAHLRPTPDRVRETVFNWLGQDMSGRLCLDLFAGSGAMGFEAASRGAERVVMVESDRGIARALQSNMQNLEAEQVEVVTMDALKFVESDRCRFDVIFLDPPYRLGLLPDLLSRLGAHLAPEGMVYVENDNAVQPDANWQVWRNARAGNIYYQVLRKR